LRACVFAEVDPAFEQVQFGASVRCHVHSLNRARTVGNRK
jgi:hypothetical protein